MTRRPWTRRRFVGTAFLGSCLLTAAGCGLQPAASFVPQVEPGSIKRIENLPGGATLTVTSKNFTEQIIQGKIALLAVTAAGFEVEDLTNVPGSQPARDLMETGEADMTWEYTGTAWLTYMGEEEGIPDRTEQWEAVAERDAEIGLTWLEPGPLNNTYALAVRDEAVEELDGVETLSDFASLPVEDRTLCVEAEFNSRQDGLDPMLEAYDIPRGDEMPEDNISLFDTGAVYTATDRGTPCNFGEVFTTDGRIDSLGLTILEDDREFFPSYNVAPVLKTETLERYPELADVFNQVTPMLTDEKMRELNLRVDEGGEEPIDVAHDFMLDEGFITEP